MVASAKKGHVKAVIHMNSMMMFLIISNHNEMMRRQCSLCLSCTISLLDDDPCNTAGWISITEATVAVVLV